MLSVMDMWSGAFAGGFQRKTTKLLERQGLQPNSCEQFTFGLFRRFIPDAE